MPLLVPPVVPPGGLSCHDQPTLTVDELVVRPWKASDAGGVTAAYRDPDIQRWHARAMTSSEAVEWVLSWRERWSAETRAEWAIVSEGQLVGRVGFRELNLVEGLGEAAYWVMPAARGRGVAARALTAVTEWMFEHAGFHRMELFHSTQNSGSCRAATKAGYDYEGTARSKTLHADGWHDMHLHGKVRGR